MEVGVNISHVAVAGIATERTHGEGMSGRARGSTATVWHVE